jgi:hypothetical protein
LELGETCAGRKAHTKRETAKHVESFGVGFWIRVRFPAPPPNQSRQLAAGSTQSTPDNPQISQTKNWSREKAQKSRKRRLLIGLCAISQPNRVTIVFLDLRLLCLFVANLSV